MHWFTKKKRGVYNVSLGGLQCRYMASISTEIADFIAINVPKHPSDIVHLVATQFSISRQRAFWYLMREVKAGKVIKTGRTRATKYFLLTGDEISFSLKIEPSLEEDRIWTQYLRQKMALYPKNIYDICQFGFTEILNNAKDHSEGKEISCSLHVTDEEVVMTILDDGVGIFRKIQHALQLSSIRESLLHLSKGKFTTDPSRHTGQGIFFTSRIFDEFSILSGGLYYTFTGNDWLLLEEKRQEEKGTIVTMKISTSSKKIAKDIFDDYANIDEDIGFHKTVVAVRLSSDDNDPHVSRSEAKRLLMGLDRFKSILLDFNNVKSVGQAFVDQVFRVFQNEHPDITISYRDANPDVEMMIKRGMAERDNKTAR